jgi:hypothetical protein
VRVRIDAVVTAANVLGIYKSTNKQVNIQITGYYIATPGVPLLKFPVKTQSGMKGKRVSNLVQCQQET